MPAVGWSSTRTSAPIGRCGVTKATTLPIDPPPISPASRQSVPGGACADAVRAHRGGDNQVMGKIVDPSPMIAARLAALATDFVPRIDALQ